MTFTAVVTAHAADPERIVANLVGQTRPPDEILVYVSNPLAVSGIVIEDDPGTFELLIVPNRDDFGHEKRAMGLARASCEFIGWFNHDDEYELTYLERMLGAVEQGADVAFCNWTNSGRDLGSVGDCAFLPGNSTAGNWIGRTSLVREAGYTERHYSADASLIARLLELRPTVVKVPATLYHHNP